MLSPGPADQERGYVVPSELERYQRTHRSLAAELAQIGFVSPGSVVIPRTSCGKPGYRGQGEPPTPRSVLPVEPRRRGQDRQPQAQPGRGRPVPRLIANRRRLQRIVSQMEELSAEMAPLPVLEVKA